MATKVERVEHGLSDHVLVIAPPGAGKVLWARAQLNKLPYADHDRCVVDSEYLYRCAGLAESWESMRQAGKNRNPIWSAVPFRAPHHSCSEAGLTGSVAKGWKLRPGELSLAHGGILLLDEATEFRRAAIGLVADVLRARMVRHRLPGGYDLLVPAEFRLIVSVNPCPCGFLDSLAVGKVPTCKCTPKAIERYLSSLDPLRPFLRHVPTSQVLAEVAAIRKAHAHA